MILEKLPDLAGLSTDEKLQLIRELYSVMEEEGDLEPNPKIVAELHRRRKDYLRDPSRVVAWEDVKRKIAPAAVANREKLPLFSLTCRGLIRL